jgi:hypothetical protein
MNRREVLAAASGLSSLAVAAGCTSPSSSTASTPKESTTRTTTRSTTSTTEESTTRTTTPTPVVEDVWVGRSFRYLYAGAHYNAYTVTGDGPVFVFALAEDGANPSLVLDGEAQDPATKLAGNVYADNVFTGRQTQAQSVVAYSLPGSVKASSAAVGDVELADALRAVLADPAAFSVTDVSVSESVQQGGEATVTITAANSGGSTGTFRAAATSESLSAFDVRHVDVAPGQRASLEVRVPIGGENEERVTYTWGSDGGESRVQVEN